MQRTRAKTLSVRHGIKAMSNGCWPIGGANKITTRSTSASAAACQSRSFHDALRAEPASCGSTVAARAFLVGSYWSFWSQIKGREA
jgi:hypothetical protein